MAAAWTSGCFGERSTPPRANLILVTIDTLRADHLGIAGYPRDTSPSLDKLAREGTWFSRCYSQSATTGASHATLFTSLEPHSHGVLANSQKFPDRVSLMTVLKREGYRTAGFVSSVVVGRRIEIQRFFDHFDDELTTHELNRDARYERPARETLDAAAMYIEGLAKDRPFFVWIHLIDPHGPYQPPVDADRYVDDSLAAKVRRKLVLGTDDWELEKIPRYQNLNGRTDADFYIARYDAEIHYADAALGLFFERLKRDGRYDSSLIVVTADHGETMVEPGHKRYFSHGTIAYEEVVRIPLIVREPGGAGALARHRFDAPVKSMDIAPTALALLGVKIPREFEGRNLLKETSGRKETIFSMGAYGSDKLEKQTGTQFSLLKNGWRYIINSKDGSKELYNHESDPNESSNVISQHADRAEVLDRELRRFLAREPAESTPVGTTSEQLEQLRSLGYVQ